MSPATPRGRSTASRLRSAAFGGAPDGTHGFYALVRHLGTDTAWGRWSLSVGPRGRHDGTHSTADPPGPA